MVTWALVGAQTFDEGLPLHVEGNEYVTYKIKMCLGLHYIHYKIN